MSRERIPSCGNAQKYKGIENFLRRIAFNLGNTASETEVKIISCIPIDVTDLQQRIVTLERQLDEVNQSKCCGAVVHAVHVDASLGKSYTNEIGHYADTIAHGSVYHRSYAGSTSKAKRSEEDQLLDTFPREEPNPPSLNVATKLIQTLLEKDKDNCCVDVPKKSNVKKCSRKLRKQREHFVYYAQTANNPFLYNPRKENRDKMKPVTEPTSGSYLTHVLKKQYRAVSIHGDVSSSLLSSPVCRDVTAGPSRKHDRTGRSCSYQDFQNLDYHMVKNTNSTRHEPALAVQMGIAYDVPSNTQTHQSYYDDRLYDIVPVKEKETNKTQLKAKYNALDAMDNMHKKPLQRVPNVEPYTVNYHTFVPERAHYTKKVSKREKILKKMSLKRDKLYSDKHYEDQYYFGEKQQTGKHCPDTGYDKHYAVKYADKYCTEDDDPYYDYDGKPSRNCVVECSTVYRKRQPGIRFYKQPNPKPINLFKKIVTINKNTEVQANVEKPKPKDDKKTEETLSQIKSILQTVLNEVKLNSQLQQNVSSNVKKDAVVQKGTSQSNMQAYSSIMNCFDYAAYNMPQFLPSYSRVRQPNPYTMPYQSLYPQQFPLLVHPPRHMCGMCYKQSPMGPALHRNIVTAATNTEKEKESGSTETAKLIKEIYKSIALSEIQKETSNSESNCDPEKGPPTKNTSHQKRESKDSQNIDRGKIETVMEIPKMKNYSSGTASATTGTKESSRTDTDDALKRRRLSTFTEEPSQYSHRNTSPPARNRAPAQYESETESKSESGSEESEETVVVSPTRRSENKHVKMQPPAKHGIFNKMKSIFHKDKARKKSTTKRTDAKAEGESSDSDYQTIYSEREHKGVRQRRGSSKLSKSMCEHSRHPKAIHSKVKHFTPSYHRDYRLYEKRKEQEFKRQFAERLRQQEAQRIDAKRLNFERMQMAQPCHYSVDATRKPFWQSFESRHCAVHYDKPRHVMVKKHAQVAAKPAPNAQSKTRPLDWLKKHKPKCSEELKKIIIQG